MNSLQAFPSSDFGICAVPMRMVFGIPCYFSQSTDAWVANGAHAASGPRFVGMYPQEGNVFARHWNNGDMIGVALGASADLVIRTLNSGARCRARRGRGPRHTGCR
jgi:hypothetical protein